MTVFRFTFVLNTAYCIVVSGKTKRVPNKCKKYYSLNLTFDIIGETRLFH